MCFSAGASFGASAILGVAGVISIKKAQSQSQNFFACIPLIFAVQQFTEGLLWVALNNDYVLLRHISTYAFIVIAQIIWPVWVPFSISFMERAEKRKKILNVFLLFGAIASVYLGYCIMVFNVQAQISEHHIKYILDFPHSNKAFVAMFYILPTVITPFISSVKRMKILGLMILTTFIVTQWFYTSYALSVWCFFAAIMSVEVFMVIKGLNKVSEK